ncbi:MAG: FHA domain-containing protein [Solirubrobacteraceae bacterium]|nr:FHA domain-containing protein [Solirubrobacteraceae bacterium]
MSVLRNLERTLSELVEGTFGRVFRSEVRPVELARKLVREMDDHKTVSVSRTYVPNEYVIYLSERDRAKYEGVEDEVAGELCAYLLEHARREKLALVARPAVEFRTDDRLSLGEFGIQARLVKPEPEAGGAAVQADHGHTMVYSTADRVRGAVESAQVSRPAPAKPLLVAEGRRHVVPPGGALLGRSRDCDVVLSDPNVSRHHAEVRPGGESGWTVQDMGSTNGVRVNGRDIRGAHPLHSGDQLELGTAAVTFELT